MDDKETDSTVVTEEMEAEKESLVANSDEAGGRHVSARRLWKKVKLHYHLVEFHALPDYLRDNDFILKHYRADWPIKQTLLSVFTLHNETINIWTHLIGFLLFLFLTIYTVKKVPTVATSLQSLSHGLHIPEMFTNCLPDGLLSSNRTIQCVLTTMRAEMANMVGPFLDKPTARWPFYIFLGGAMFCLLSSAIFHLLSCHSARLAYFMVRLDYAGISSLIAASFFPPVYYGFICKPHLQIIYLSAISFLGMVTIAVSLIPVFQTPEYRNFRAILFFGMGISGVIPCIHKLLLYPDDPAAISTTAYEALMGLLYGLGALLYAARIPERWKPGLFDIAGHSHQIFHVLVVAGAFTHYKTGLLYLKWRDAKGCGV
eukprot:TRINITY_DN1379_c0_g1_i1.p1 TRINITY_DN1379_c0_g1~~TRINITY_DN1379_c0_g1_i1.p1  ORF type:complete len:372 (-),score=23.74 TRINITY_DN1379_c0_g1_i1:514-1629(-)